MSGGVLDGPGSEPSKLLRRPSAVGPAYGPELVVGTPCRQVRVGELHDELLIEFVAEGHRTLCHGGCRRRESLVAKVMAEEVHLTDVAGQCGIYEGKAWPHAEVVVAVRGRPPTSPPVSVRPGQSRIDMRRQRQDGPSGRPGINGAYGGTGTPGLRSGAPPQGLIGKGRAQEALWSPLTRWDPFL